MGLYTIDKTRAMRLPYTETVLRGPARGVFAHGPRKCMELDVDVTFHPSIHPSVGRLYVTIGMHKFPYMLCARILPSTEAGENGATRGAPYVCPPNPTRARGRLTLRSFVDGV